MKMGFDESARRPLVYEKTDYGGVGGTMGTVHAEIITATSAAASIVLMTSAPSPPRHWLSVPVS
jgi:hypothetical protein